MVKNKKIKLNPRFFPDEIYGSESFLDYSSLHVASIVPSNVDPARAPNFKGHIQQLTFNGVQYIEKVQETRFECTLNTLLINSTPF